jgi:DNA replication protein DnaC
MRARKLSQIPKRFANATFASYRPSRYKQPDGKVITLPIALKGFKRSYFLAGDFGKGKTHLLVAQYRAFTEAGFFQTCFVRERELLEDLQFQAYKEDYTPRLVSLKELERKDYVHFFIDDLGKTKITEDRLNQLFYLIDVIYSKNFGLSLTTNYRIKELEERWELVDETNGGGIVRRLQDICQPISMFEQAEN